MRLELTNIKDFIRIFDAISAVIHTDLTIRFYPDYMNINQITTARTGMIVANIGEEYFDGYRAEDELIGVDISYFMGALKMFKNAKRVVMETDEANLYLYTETERKKKRTSVALLADAEFESESMALEFKTTVKLSSDGFKDAMKDAALTGDDAIFKMTPTELTVTTSGGRGANKDSWQIGDDMIVLTSKEAKSVYPADLLSDIAGKGASLSKDVMISFNNNSPLKLTYDLKHGVLMYYLAPIIDPRYENI